MIANTPPSLRKPQTVIALGLTVILGLLSRLYPLGWYGYDKSLGDVLYAVAVYLVLALLLPRRGPRFTAFLALMLCVGVELFKLTGIPAATAHLPLVPWLLGHSFSWHNLACYALGVALVGLIDLSVLRIRPDA